MTEKPLHILLVEDNPHDARLIRELLDETGLPLDITTVSDGEKAIMMMEQVIEGGRGPDLVLLDLNLPKKNGHEVLEFIRSKEAIAHACVVIYTGSRSPDDDRRARRNKVNGYLVKPMGAKEMDVTIQELNKILITVSKGSCPSYANGK
jgi:CheY-like chemotaxis protein